MPTETTIAGTPAEPVSQNERITIIDSLRGIAILGILMMNIPGFALPQALFGDLNLLHEAGTINANVWYFIDFFLEGSQRAIFSMLFGAGVILFVSRQEKKVQGMWPADYFLRRQLWLLFFGLFNSFILLWFWDILIDYACCGIIVFAFRRLSPKALLIAAGICLVLMTVRENYDYYKVKTMIVKGETVAAMDTTVTKLNDKQKAQLAAMTEFRESGKPENKQKKMQEQLETVRGNYADFYEYNSERRMHSLINYFFYGLWDVLSFMFIGMAFYKSGILMGKAPTRYYVWMCIVGLGIGLTVSYFRLQPLFEYQYNRFEITKNVSFEYYEISRTLRAIGIFGLIMLMYKSGVFKWFFALLRPVGQMAFTNYLMQSFMVGVFFYGIGFGMYGKLQRYEMYYVVAATWTIQIIYSHIWLHFFRFGPLEWTWRSLTYWKLQPMKKRAISQHADSEPVNILA
jgi:uncharacterized protein